MSPASRFAAVKNPSGGGGEANENPGAGDGDGFGLARFGEGGELIRGVEVKVGDPQFTLIWNTDSVDLDLHVIEPGGKEIYWEEPKGQRGASSTSTTPRDSVPRMSTGWSSRRARGLKKSKGPARPVIYRWFVVYWGGFGGIARPTHWQVRVKHDGKVNVYHGKFSHLNERSKIYSLKVAPPGSKTAETASEEHSLIREKYRRRQVSTPRLTIVRVRLERLIARIAGAGA